MKEKLHFYNISRTLVSFCLFVIIGRLAGFLIGTVSTFDGMSAELLRFIFSAAFAVLAFLQFENLIPSPDEKQNSHPVMAGRYRERPFSMRRYVLQTIPYTFVTAALLIVSMYLVTTAFDLGGSLIHTETPGSPLIQILSMILIHPIAEEYLFRGLYYRELRSMSPIFACLMQGVMFAIAHNGVGGMMYALVAGILLGAAAERSNGIAVPIAAHIIINLRTFLYTGYFSDSVQFAADIALIAAGGLSALLLFAVSKKLPVSRPADRVPEVREEADFED